MTEDDKPLSQEEYKDTVFFILEMTSTNDGHIIDYETICEGDPHSSTRVIQNWY